MPAAEMTPPPRQPQPRHPARAPFLNKENRKPPPPITETQATRVPYPLSPVQTPTKKSVPGQCNITVAVERLGPVHPWGLEVKNTFIHIASPMKTLTVVSPPKTVPPNFAPEYAFFDKPRTPMAHAPQPSTPSTIGCSHTGLLSGCGPLTGGAFTSGLHYMVCPGPFRASGPEALAQGVAGKPLRLFDHLPLPLAGGMPGPMQDCQLPLVGVPQHCDGAAMGGWRSFDAMPAMPQVPPLPMPGFGGFEPMSYQLGEQCVVGSLAYAAVGEPAPTLTVMGEQVLPCRGPCDVLCHPQGLCLDDMREGHTRRASLGLQVSIFESLIRTDSQGPCLQGPYQSAPPASGCCGRGS